MDFNGLNRVFLSHHQSNLWDFSFTMFLREIRGICVRRGGRCGVRRGVRWREDVGEFGNVGNCD